LGEGYGLYRLRKNSEFRVKLTENISQGLNRLRKNYDSEARLEKYIPQGLKPAVFCCIYGTTEVVPFQNIDLFRGPLVVENDV
jgi:hypothetical protein